MVSGLLCPPNSHDGSGRTEKRNHYLVKGNKDPPLQQSPHQHQKPGTPWPLSLPTFNENSTKALSRLPFPKGFHSNFLSAYFDFNKCLVKSFHCALKSSPVWWQEPRPLVLVSGGGLSGLPGCHLASQGVIQTPRPLVGYSVDPDTNCSGRNCRERWACRIRGCNWFSRM